MPGLPQEQSISNVPWRWTPDRVDKLCVLWDRGWSTARIGAYLGCGKNAVIGKAHRLGLTPRGSPIRRVPQLRIVPTTQP